MKKLIAAISALSLIATPADAHPRGERHGGYERSERHGGGCGVLCGVILGGVVVGAIASSSRRDRAYQDSYEYTPPERQYQYVCQNEYMRDYNGNYILDQYGRAMFRQRCWYQ